MVDSNSLVFFVGSPAMPGHLGLEASVSKKKNPTSNLVKERDFSLSKRDLVF
jgi:hypothetical protein